ncbi:MAG TPA: acyltransferase domain-containing protein, partial [Ideonella sp.]|nr:acyltransferase domain-containing protein [Ideonella sp.]
SAFAQRACVVATTPAEAAERLRAAESPWKAAHAVAPRQAGVVFMFPGQGSHYAGMGRGLYESEAVFRAAVDECLQALGGEAGAALREALFADDPAGLQPTAVAQPALFVLGYALAQQWRSLGVEPVALIGHSVGEFVAAALAGVFSAADAMRLVARRGALMQALPAGAMLSVGLPAEAVAARLPAGLAIAAHNAPASCVVSGPIAAIAALRTELEAQGAVTRPLQTSHAFHSPMMDPVVAAFEAELRDGGVVLRAPSLPIVSTLTGQRLEAAQATDPSYWARHLRETVRFSPALHELQRSFDGAVLLEVGPRQTLATLARQHRAKDQPPPVALASLADAPDKETAALRLAAGRLWALGATVDTARLAPRTRARRLRLPTYPFERKLFWVDARPAAATPAPGTDFASPPPGPRPAPVAVPTVPSPEPAMSVSPAPGHGARRPQLVTRLRGLVEDLAGVELDAGASFVEQGLDSLQLTQFALQVKRAFKVNLSFRQLMESLRTLDALAQHLDEQLPAEALAAAVPAAAPP